MKKLLAIAIVIAFFASLSLASPVYEESESKAATILFTDSCGRTVELPSVITKAAPSGAVATMMFAAIAPEYMCNVNSAPSEAQMKYLPGVLSSLPATGQLYGSKATLNLEELIATGAQVLVDMGDYKNGIAEDLDRLQAQIGIPCIFLEADLGHMAQAFRSLGQILSGKAERAEALASFIDETVDMAARTSALISEAERVSIMYTSGPDGLGTNSKGSSQAQVIDLIGADNAIVLEKYSSKGGGNQISLEQLYNFAPEIVIFSEASIYSTVESDPAWQVLNARYYEIPCQPYSWMSNPPSMNMVLGIWWLGNLVYPQYYDYDMTKVAQDFYKLFWDYDLSEAEAKAMLANSTLKD